MGSRDQVREDPCRARALERVAFRCESARCAPPLATQEVSGKHFSRSFGVRTLCLLRPRCFSSLLACPGLPRPFRTPPHPPAVPWVPEVMAASSKLLPKVEGQGRGGAHLARRDALERRRREQAPERPSSSLGAPGPAPGPGVKGRDLRLPRPGGT